MLIIRLKPIGRKYNKKYRLVAAPKRRHVKKLVNEYLGHYDPISKILTINNKEKLDTFIKNNIEISDTAQSILKKNNLL
jgi:ribosomal protein S16